MIASCIVMHCGADCATSAPQIFFYNNKLQFSDPTTNQAACMDLLVTMVMYRPPNLTNRPAMVPRAEGRGQWFR